VKGEVMEYIVKRDDDEGRKIRTRRRPLTDEVYL